MKKNETEILEFINNLKAYQGYIQMSDKPINLSSTTKDACI
jgi:hypothetical protein